MKPLITTLGLALLMADFTFAADHPAVRRDDPATIHGAVYVASEAFNAPQMWKNFSAAETDRDFGYAQKINVNALRVWASYEYWKMEPQKFQTAFDQMLVAAEKHGIRILISLFEDNGSLPTPENMWTTDPAKAFCIQSPGAKIASVENKAQWNQPAEFLTWFMKRYGNDDRLLAIEVMNEPRDKPHKTFEFAEAMLVEAKKLQGTVPLTMGCVTIGHDEKLIPLGLDVIQFHDNFPSSSRAIEQHIQRALETGKKYNLPVWLTEWQRVRTSGPGWGKKNIPADDLNPDYTSLAASVQKYPVGNFFWSLMVKRAYLSLQRGNGTVNGLFWPDGSVWSLADARAIARDPKLNLPEKHSLPPGFLDYLKQNRDGAK